MKSITCPIAVSVLALSSPLHALEGDFLAPFEHIHYSPIGTPIIHSFGVEPAFTGRDFFLDHSWREGGGVTEHETELEMEWAFTKRLGVIVEVPYIWEDEEGVGSASGVGDLAIVPRAMLIVTDRFMLTTQIELGLPTGSSAFGGETSIAPGIAMWNDLGNWFTLNTNIAIAHGFDSNETELEFGFGLVKSFGEKPDLSSSHDHHGHDHRHDHPSVAGLINLHLEITGSTPINGDDKGDFETEGLIGISYGVSPEMDIRLGYQFPISTPKDFDHGLTTGLIWHF
ncbi:hypothetical protein HZ994_09170 [Akkermansiaceae bacterium]|nr:hypothetical protein HZ994_09170 [Akkermansiaceae bacterium]